MKKNGFSLIELLIASALISFLIVGTAHLLMLSLAAKKKAEFHRAATYLATSQLEYLKSLPFESPELKEGSSSESVRENITSENLLKEWQIENIDESLKKVEVRVSSLVDRHKKATFLLLISRELGF